MSSPLERGDRGVCNILWKRVDLTMKINYNPKLKELARKLRNNSTKSEIKLWQCLKGKKMMGYVFNRQKPINNIIVDFFCNKLKLVIELDGYTHTFEEIAIKDKLKEEKLQALGISVLRFWDEDVAKDLEGVLKVIQDFIRRFERNY